METLRKPLYQRNKDKKNASNKHSGKLFVHQAGTIILAAAQHMLFEQARQWRRRIEVLSYCIEGLVCASHAVWRASSRIKMCTEVHHARRTNHRCVEFCWGDGRLAAHPPSCGEKKLGILESMVNPALGSWVCDFS